MACKNLQEQQFLDEPSFMIILTPLKWLLGKLYIIMLTVKYLTRTKQLLENLVYNFFVFVSASFCLFFCNKQFTAIINTLFFFSLNSVSGIVLTQPQVLSQLSLYLVSVCFLFCLKSVSGSFSAQFQPGLRPGPWSQVRQSSLVFIPAVSRPNVSLCCNTLHSVKLYLNTI